MEGSAKPNHNQLWIRLGIAVVAVFVFQVILWTREADAIWHTMFWYGLVLIFTAELAITPAQFFRGEGVNVLSKEWITSRFTVIKSWMKRQKDEEKVEDDDKGEDEEGEEGSQKKTSVGFWTLMPSAFITWIFAKSIHNASSLGGRFGVVGGIAYAGWYTSFISAAVVAYFLRTGRYKFTSLSQAINQCYGSLATLSFGLALIYRLYNEVWSNSLVVAAFYGSVHSGVWWLAVIASTVIPVIYVLMGGMRSSLMSDVLQAVIAVVFLLVLLVYIGIKMPDGFGSVLTQGADWTLVGGLDLLLAALLQGLISYPFHDPVLTDRTFISTPKTMLVSFVVGGIMGGAFIILFSFIGVYGNALGIGGEPSVVARTLGNVAYTVVVLIMLTSSMSTLDSTFTSTAKLAALEIGGWIRPFAGAVRGPLKLDSPEVDKRHVLLGRAAIVAIAFFGTLPLIANMKALDATTVSGTTIMGMGVPIIMMIFWRPQWKQSPLAFHLCFWFGVVFGICFQVPVCTDELNDAGTCVKRSFLAGSGMELGEGSYALLLGVNFYGVLISALGWLIGFLLHQWVIPRLPFSIPFLHEKQDFTFKEDQDDVKSVQMKVLEE